MYNVHVLYCTIGTVPNPSYRPSQFLHPLFARTHMGALTWVHSLYSKLLYCLSEYSFAFCSGSFAVYFLHFAPSPHLISAPSSTVQCAPSPHLISSPFYSVCSGPHLISAPSSIVCSKPSFNLFALIHSMLQPSFNLSALIHSQLQALI